MYWCACANIHMYTPVYGWYIYIHIYIYIYIYNSCTCSFFVQIFNGHWSLPHQRITWIFFVAATAVVIEIQIYPLFYELNHATWYITNHSSFNITFFLSFFLFSYFTIFILSITNHSSHNITFFLSFFPILLSLFFLSFSPYVNNSDIYGTRYMLAYIYNQ